MIELNQLNLSTVYIVMTVRRSCGTVRNVLEDYYAGNFIPRSKSWESSSKFNNSFCDETNGGGELQRRYILKFEESVN